MNVIINLISKFNFPKTNYFHSPLLHHNHCHLQKYFLIITNNLKFMINPTKILTLLKFQYHHHYFTTHLITTINYFTKYQHKLHLSINFLNISYYYYQHYHIFYFKANNGSKIHFESYSTN